MNPRTIVAVVAVSGLAAAAWFYRGSAPVNEALRAAGVPTASTAPPSLQAAGVHKCVGVSGTTYLGGPCPKGSREVESNGGTMTVVSMPKSTPAPSAPFGLGAGPIIKPMDADERDRLRDRQIEDAANRR